MGLKSGGGVTIRGYDQMLVEKTRIGAWGCRSIRNVNKGECMSVKKLSVKKIKSVKGGSGAYCTISSARWKAANGSSCSGTGSAN